MKTEASVPYFLPAAWLMGPGYCAVTAFIAPWGGDIGQIELVRPTTLQMLSCMIILARKKQEGILVLLLFSLFLRSGPAYGFTYLIPTRKTYF